MFLTIATEGQFEFILEKFENSPEDYNFLIIQMSKRNYCRIIYNSISTLYEKKNRVLNGSKRGKYEKNLSKK